jgi:hypothetical protein
LPSAFMIWGVNFAPGQRIGQAEKSPDAGDRKRATS